MNAIPAALEWHIRFREHKSKEESAYIVQILQLFERKLHQKYLTILDVGCGNGRIHPLLRKKGFKVYGIDTETALLKEAKEKFPAYAENYYKKDMRKFTLKKRFDVMLSWFTSFGYFSDTGNLSVLKSMKKNLKKDGLLLLDIPNKQSRKFRRKKFSHIQMDGLYVEKIDNSIEQKNNQTVLVFTQQFYGKDGKKLQFIKKKQKKVRLYDKNEIIPLLDKAGFEIISVFKTMSFFNARADAKRILIIAKPKK
ncbi:class I SAM-dependent methyltransferase [Candidatus Woesearchaeota archaeon]|nr:MAG: class I SAM-dependent methyltransferase [Candidatus Woesearchaeota archaeon]